MNGRADATPKPRPTTPRPPSAPKPSSPKPRGHLPIGAELPDLHDLLDAAELLGARMIGLLKRGYDPADDGSAVPAYVGIRLMCAAADVRSALAMLQQIRTSSSVRQVSTSMPEVRIATTGGPPQPPVLAGECLTPGYAAVPAARESGGAVAAPSQANTNPLPTAGERADTPARTTGFPAAVVEAPGSSEAVPGAGVQLLTRAEVADLFGVDAQTIWSWRRSGRLDCVRPGGGYRESDVLALLAADRVVKTGASP